MSEHYDDATVEAAMDAIDNATLSDGLGVFETGTVTKTARALLDAVAPLIAAKALRDGQAQHERWADEADGHTARTIHRVIADAFRVRAVEIERGRS